MGRGTNGTFEGNQATQNGGAIFQDYGSVSLKSTTVKMNTARFGAGLYREEGALSVTGSTINVESLMGSIMAVGIATSNSILLVSYANDARVERHISPIEAALEAGKTRLRPVLMTALAMIIGMIPMALAMGEAGEQNAPLGRAVIGGLLCATVATLVFVPSVFSLLHKTTGNENESPLESPAHRTHA